MKEQLEEYFTEHERSNIGLVIKTRFGYVDHSYLDDLCKVIEKQESK